MGQKDELSPHQQRSGFARAFDTVQHYLAAGNLIGAYVIAFSILEDRITTIFVACTSRALGSAKQPSAQPYLALNKKINHLAQQGIITATDQGQWLSIARERNRKLHKAMWNLDEFQPADVEKVVVAARRASNLRKVQKRLQVKQSKQDKGMT